jgi:hypothetical protein
MKVCYTAGTNSGGAVKFLYAFVVGFVAVSMIYVVDRFEPNRLLARILTAIVYLTGALAILAKLG